MKLLLKKQEIIDALAVGLVAQGRIQGATLFTNKKYFVAFGTYPEGEAPQTVEQLVNGDLGRQIVCLVSDDPEDLAKLAQPPPVPSAKGGEGG